MPKSLASCSSSVSEIPFVRKRLQPQQAAVLQAVFETKTHPTVEERAELASELGLELKAINVWYQNKRRSVKKQSAAWKPPTFKPRVPVKALSRSSSSSSFVSRSSVSLDSVAGAHERPDTAPRTPQRPKPTPAPLRPQTMWELIPSSPTAPLSSPAAESVRLSALPATSKTMRSLEWACAKDRAGRKKRRRRHGASNVFDVPPLPSLDLSSGKDNVEGSDTELEEAITPDTSVELAHFQTPVRKRCGTEEWGPEEEGGKENEPPHSDVEAAMALLGFKVRS